MDVNPSKSKGHQTTFRLLVDSRDRDPTIFPSAADFVMHLATPVKGVKAITLTDARIPIVDATDFPYVVVVLSNIKDNTLLQCKEGTGYPQGALAMVQMIPAQLGANYAYYDAQRKDHHGGGWRVEFPFALGQLWELHFQIWTWVGDSTGWGGATVPPELYQLSTESTSRPASIDNNVWFGLEIEHQL